MGVSYSNANRNNEHDEFITPTPVLHAIFKFLSDQNDALSSSVFEAARVLDPGANTGRWGQVYHQWRRSYEDAEVYYDLHGVEILEDVPVSFTYDRWFTQDFLEFQPEELYDLIMGNFPYSFRGDTRETVIYDFIHHGMSLLNPSGTLITLVRNGITHNIKQWEPGGIFYEHPWYGNCPIVPRPNFADEDDRYEGGGARHDSTLLIFRKSASIHEYPYYALSCPIVWKTSTYKGTLEDLQKTLWNSTIDG